MFFFFSLLFMFSEIDVNIFILFIDFVFDLLFMFLLARVHDAKL